MTRSSLCCLALLIFSAPLAAQTTIGGGSRGAASPSARPAPTPGVGRSPGASALPVTPGANSHARQRPLQSRSRQDRPYVNRRGYSPVYGYGGVYIDNGAGPIKVPQQTQTESASAYVVAVPPREEKAPPTPRVYDIREDIEGNVEMTPIHSTNRPAAVSSPSADAPYWLIALRNGQIHATSRYSTRGDTLQFKTRDGTQFVVSLSELDRPFTERLNSDLGRSIDVR
jgi:hypothetical protein